MSQLGLIIFLMIGVIEMFHFFQNKEAAVPDHHLYMPVTGKLIELSDVNDQVFSSKMMGEGFAVNPADGNIMSPVSGKVISIFETKHAMGIKMANGLDVLVHLGIDTVELKGSPFEVYVKEGQTIKGGEKLAKMDLNQLESAKKENTVIVVFTNSDRLKGLSIDKHTDDVERGEIIGEVK
jgi:glucose-specific phosphotransferase system IIA component